MSKPLILDLKEKITDLTTYSTEEVKTGEKWVDGKPIYKKVVQVTLSDTNSHATPHNIANVDKIWLTEDGSFLWVDNTSIPANYYRDSSAYIWAFVSTTNVQYRTNAAGWANNKPMYLTLKYTKTTD